MSQDTQVLKLKVQVAQQALLTLGEALGFEKTDINRDGTIQRFEFSFELMWKLLQATCRFKGSLELYGSRDAIRESARYGLISNPDLWISFLEARNRTSHMYSRVTADEVYQKAQEFYPEAIAVLKAISKQFEEDQ